MQEKKYKTCQLSGEVCREAALDRSQEEERAPEGSLLSSSVAVAFPRGKDANSAVNAVTAFHLASPEHELESSIEKPLEMALIMLC